MFGADGVGGLEPSGFDSRAALCGERARMRATNLRRDVTLTVD
jgi:hypothetical protein